MRKIQFLGALLELVSKGELEQATGALPVRESILLINDVLSAATPLWKAVTAFLTVFHVEYKHSETHLIQGLRLVHVEQIKFDTRFLLEVGT